MGEQFGQCVRCKSACKNKARVIMGALALGGCGRDGKTAMEHLLYSWGCLSSRVHLLHKAWTSSGMCRVLKETWNSTARKRCGKRFFTATLQVSISRISRSALIA